MESPNITHGMESPHNKQSFSQINLNSEVMSENFNNIHDDEFYKVGA